MKYLESYGKFYVLQQADNRINHLKDKLDKHKKYREEGKESLLTEEEVERIKNEIDFLEQKKTKKIESVKKRDEREKKQGFRESIINKFDKWSGEGEDGWRDLYHGYMNVYSNNLKKVWEICEREDLLADDKIQLILNLKQEVSKKLKKVDLDVEFPKRLQVLDDWFEELVRFSRS